MLRIPTAIPRTRPFYNKAPRIPRCPTLQFGTYGCFSTLYLFLNRTALAKFVILLRRAARRAERTRRRLW
jgi:hypothetical protein